MIRKSSIQKKWSFKFISLQLCSSEVERVSTEAVGGTVQSVWAEIQGRGLTSACVGKIASFDIGASSALRSDDIDVKILCKFCDTVNKKL